MFTVRSQAWDLYNVDTTANVYSECRVCSKIIELEEELKIVSNNMKSLEIAEQEAHISHLLYFLITLPLLAFCFANVF